MSEQEAAYRVTTTGVRGTDNCPVCGWTMRKSRVEMFGKRYLALKCSQKDHMVQVFLAYGEEAEQH